MADGCVCIYYEQFWRDSFQLAYAFVYWVHTHTHAHTDYTHVVVFTVVHSHPFAKGELCQHNIISGHGTSGACLVDIKTPSESQGGQNNSDKVFSSFRYLLQQHSLILKVITLNIYYSS